MREMYRCPCCGHHTSDNFQNEHGQIICQGIVIRHAKLTRCEFPFFINKFNTYYPDVMTDQEKRIAGLRQKGN